MESGYYPMGSTHDPRAPWNEQEPQFTYEKLSIPFYINEEVTENYPVYIKWHSGLEHVCIEILNYPSEIEGYKYWEDDMSHNIILWARDEFNRNKQIIIT